MSTTTSDPIFDNAVSLLKKLIATPSFSREEAGTAALISDFFKERSIPFQTIGNNILVSNKHWDPAKPTLLLNSHHDTVKPNESYSRNPFLPEVEDGKLFGLGSNDAGGPLVALIGCFIHYYDQPGLNYNIMLVASAEEEISGSGGIESVLHALPAISFALVGEPTLMQMAVAERGLMVIDAEARGKAGHAARNEGLNAIRIAVDDIQWLNQYQFPRVSTLLGPVQANVTVISTENKAHNVVPDRCRFVIDTRVNELYTFEEILDILRSNMTSILEPRSMRLKSSAISMEHPVVKSGLSAGLSCYGSPTSSDKALMPFPALKIGPGDSARSHTADEFIYLDEIRQGIALYIQLLDPLLVRTSTTDI